MQDETPADDGTAPTPPAEGHGEPLVDVDELPIRLVFVAGETEVPLRRLQRMAPGYVFELREPVDAHVEVRANGRAVASGELVDVDGRVGVRILECRLPESG